MKEEIWKDIPGYEGKTLCWFSLELREKRLNSSYEVY